jgi:iron complex transport system substrate-binding protein
MPLRAPSRLRRRKSPVRTAVAAAALLALALVAGACGFKEEPLGKLASFPQTVHDGEGRSVRIAAQPHRIVSLDAGLTESAFAIGAGGAVVAGSGGEVYPRPARRLPAAVTASGKLRVRALRHLRPDLVLARTGTSPEGARALSARLGAPVYVAGSSSLDGVLHDIFQLGLVTGRTGHARRLVAQLRGRIADVRAALASDEPVRTFIDLGFFYTIPTTGLAADLLRLAGGTNVATQNPFPPARLRSAAPQVYLAVVGSGSTLAGLRRARATRNLPAVRHHRFAMITRQLLTDSGPRAVDALETLARALHPTLQLGQ